MKRYTEIITAFAIFAVYSGWWLVASLQHNTIQQADFSDFYWILPLVGGIYGFFSARKWGGLRSLFGRALIFLSLGLFFQVFGQVYNSVYATY